jgi:hypothetical protein
MLQMLFYSTKTTIKKKINKKKKIKKKNCITTIFSMIGIPATMRSVSLLTAMLLQGKK